jgi:hypothetical protein
VAALADHHLVQRRERLTVVGAHLHHRALADRCGSRLRGGGEGDSCRGVCGTSTPALTPGSGSMPMTGWMPYFAALATSPSCPTTSTTSSGSKTKRARSLRSTVARRQSTGARGHVGQGGAGALVPLFDGGEALASLIEEGRPGRACRAGRAVR